MWRFGARDVDAARRLDLFVVSGVATVLVVRGYLAALDYPQVGGGGLHIAHAVWGGLFMALALMLAVSSLSRRDRWIVALVGGIGFGLFIDELGKFITADVDYFFEPTAALIYVSFLAIYLIARLVVDRPALTKREALENAIDLVRQAAARPLYTSEREQIQELLAHSDPEHPLTRSLEATVAGLPAAADRPPSRLEIAWGRARALFERVVERPITRWLIAVVAVIFVIGDFLQVLTLIVGQGDLTDASGASTEDGFVAWAATIGSIVQAVLIAVGLLKLRRSRLEAYRWLERGLLVNLLVTQVFLFAQDQFSATTGFLISLVMLAAIRVLIGTEHALGRAGRSSVEDRQSAEPIESYPRSSRI